MNRAAAPVPAAERRRRRRDWRIAGIVALGLVALLALEQRLLVSSRALPIGSDAVFLALVHLNVIGIGVLVFLLARNIVKLVVERRRGIFGARLNTRFVVSFGFVAAVSSTALFVLSAFLVSRAVNVWFELELSDDLGRSLEVADAYYRDAEDKALWFARRIAGGIESHRLLREDALDELRGFVTEKREEYDLGVVEVFSATHEPLATATHPEVAVVAFEAPDSGFIRDGLAGVTRTVIQQAGPGELIRVVVPVRSTFKPRDVVGVVVVNRFVPRSIGAHVAAIQAGMDAYRRLQPSEGIFQASVLVLLGMITLLSLLFSTWLGFRLAKQVSEPIQRLAAATAEVAAGNLDVRLERRGDDEFGELMTEFNRMATDLSASREDLERRRAQMEIILSSVAAGVISLDPDSVVLTLNPTALRLLGIPPGDWLGHKIGELVEGEALDGLNGLLRRLGAGSLPTVRRQMQLPVGEELRNLNWTVSRIHDVDGDAAGFVVVIDDVTEMAKVQRMGAWREVARRIAHEIKNPLTPIQLSAERLRHKLAGRLGDPEAESLLEQCTDSITGEVRAVKDLLHEFSNFARLPAIDPVPTDLNKLVTDTVAMYEGRHSITFETDLAADLPTFDLDREQIKRVILNLVDNAMTAIDEADRSPGEEGGSAADEAGPREIRVATRFEREVGTVRLEVADTGCGIRREDQPRLFEPYYSTKPRGSGLGLAIVSRIVSDHSGYIRVRANRPRGTRFIVELPTRT
jgi:two-component system nitrogen regulation sensor histidine kinase NtrY